MLPMSSVRFDCSRGADADRVQGLSKGGWQRVALESYLIWRYKSSQRLGSGEIVVNPSFKRERYARRRLPALQGKVAAADQMAHRAVVDPNHEARSSTRLLISVSELSAASPPLGSAESYLMPALYIVLSLYKVSPR
jgi:hypothetical protein